MDLDDARRKVEDWRVEYNEVSPHSAVGERPPMALLAKALVPSEVAAEPGTLLNRFKVREAATGPKTCVEARPAKGSGPPLREDGP
jgi:hypothetical protein